MRGLVALVGMLLCLVAGLAAADQYVMKWKRA